VSTPNHNEHNEPDDHDRGNDPYAPHGIPISDEETHLITLSLHELLYIDDHSTLLINQDDYEGSMTLRPPLPMVGLPCDMAFIKKIGEALLKAFADPGRDVDVLLADSHLFLIREMALTHATLGNSKVGISLKRKIYEKLLSQSEADKTVASLLDSLDIDFGDSNEPKLGLD